jgi:hypothetical protein
MPTYQKTGTIRDRLEALDFLRSVVVVENGYGAYKEGWSDKKVSRHLRLGLSARVIATLRREYLGKSRPHMERYNAGVGEAMLAGKRQKHQLAAAVEQFAAPATPAIIVPIDRLAAIEAKVDALLSALGVRVEERKDI